VFHRVARYCILCDFDGSDDRLRLFCFSVLLFLPSTATVHSIRT